MAAWMLLKPFVLAAALPALFMVRHLFLLADADPAEDASICAFVTLYSFVLICAWEFIR